MQIVLIAALASFHCPLVVLFSCCLFFWPLLASNLTLRCAPQNHTPTQIVAQTEVTAQHQPFSFCLWWSVCVCWQLCALSQPADSPRSLGHAGVRPPTATHGAAGIQTNTLILTEIVPLKQEFCLEGRSSMAFLDFDKSHSWLDHRWGCISRTCTQQSSALLDTEVHFNLKWFAWIILTDETKHWCDTKSDGLFFFISKIFSRSKISVSQISTMIKWTP